MKKALITGISGQDGSYLAELLLGKGYEVHGVVRRSSIENSDKIKNLENCIDQVKLHTASLNDHLAIYKLISFIRPDECYHFAASSFVSYTFEDEMSIMSTNFSSTHFLLSSIKELVPACKFYFSGSSEMFGDAEFHPQDEETRFNPRSIYGIAKLASYYIVKRYREQHGLFACTGIAYNHESPRRDSAFVTRKITLAVAKIYLGLSDGLELGNIDATRDWGYAPEFVEGMWRMLACTEETKDYVLCTGIAHTVRDVLEVAFSAVQLEYEKYVKSKEDYFRPSERVILLGNHTKIKRELGWEPQVKFDDMIREMVKHDIALLSSKM